MPFGSVASLKQSKTWAADEELRKMPAFRLQRFVDVFDAIFQKKKAGGAGDKEAEATAFAMAYAAARRFQPTPSTAKLEDAEHHFVPLMPLQFSLGGEVEVQSFAYVKDNFDIINAAVSLNAFNLDHEHSEPTGVIRRLVLPDDPSIPAAAKAKMHKETPFVAVGSFFVDTPDEIRAVTAISGEWLQIKKESGDNVVFLPDSFAIITEGDPATGEDLGVQKLATADGKEAAVLDAEHRNMLKESQFACPEDESFPIHDAAHVRAALSRINQPHTSKCSKESMMGRIHAAAKKFGVEVAGDEDAKDAKAAAAAAPERQANGNQPKKEYPAPEASPPMPDETIMTPAEFEAKVASLGADLDKTKKELEATKTALKMTELKASSWKSEFEKMEGLIAEMKQKDFERQANYAAQALLNEGKISADQTTRYAALYAKLGKEEFETLVADMPRGHLGAFAAKAAAAIPRSADAIKAERERMARLLKEA